MEETGVRVGQGQGKRNPEALHVYCLMSVYEPMMVGRPHPLYIEANAVGMGSAHSGNGFPIDFPAVPILHDEYNQLFELLLSFT